MLDVLLIKPPFSRLKGMHSVQLPLGIGYLAESLRKYFDVKIYNMDDPLSADEEHRLESEKCSSKLCYSRSFLLSDNYKRSLEQESFPAWLEAREVFLQYQPKIIGISTTSAEYPSALKVASIYKDCFPEGIVVVGGQHPTIQSEEVIANDNVDYLVRGEGEETFLELVSTLLDRDGAHADLTKMDGISFRRGDSVVHTKDRSLLSELDALGFPARDLLLKPIKNASAYGDIITSRGCPFNCGFCSAKSIWGRQVRYRSSQNVIAEIEQVKDTYKTKRFNFRDDTFNLDYKRTKQLLSDIKKLKIEWECTTCVNSVDYPALKEMKEAGCIAISYGIESGSERMQKIINKNLTIEKINQVLSETVKAKIIPRGFLMVGFPEETEDDIKYTIKFVRQAKIVDIGLAVFTPYPGTPLFERASELGLITRDIKWEDISHQSQKNFFVKNMTREKFHYLLCELIRVVDKHNSSFKVLFMRITIMMANNPRVVFRRIILKLQKILKRY